jgi:hypothetical protein
VEVSQKAKLHLQDRDLQPRIERHFQFDGGYLDEVDQLRNQVSLESKSGIIESRFDLETSSQILMIRSDLDRSWTYVFLFGEE